MPLVAEWALSREPFLLFRQVDLLTLRSMIDLPSLNYVDVSAQMELLQAFERWPLLAHVEEQQRAQPLDLSKSTEQRP